MSPGVAKLLVFAVPVLAFLVWQIVSVSRDLERDNED